MSRPLIYAVTGTVVLFFGTIFYKAANPPSIGAQIIDGTIKAMRDDPRVRKPDDFSVLSRYLMPAPARGGCAVYSVTYTNWNLSQDVVDPGFVIALDTALYRFEKYHESDTQRAAFRKQWKRYCSGDSTAVQP